MEKPNKQDNNYQVLTTNPRGLLTGESLKTTSNPNLELELEFERKKMNQLKLQVHGFNNKVTNNISKVRRIRI